ncbi:class I adenylate-forming enzyme family protein [Parafrankia discariae]|uniref:class I adenylate-forming enzyme family protein n=1 Tax=Parafrankia discariae TaxID=365528 RepID=UPI0003A453DE|nr:class I adenylate-forming enzyme family protein [Parafrankia discariae]
MSETLLDVIRAHSSHRPALVDRDKTLTYADLAAAVEARVKDLRAAGLRPGTRVALTMTTRAESVVDFAALTAGLAAVLVLQERAGDQEKAAAMADFHAEIVLDAAGLRRRLPAGSTGGDPAFAVSSSGTSGRPKVISREWAGTLANSAAFARTFGIGPGDVVLTTSPLGHSYAIEAGTLAVLSTGACQLVPDGPLTSARAKLLVRKEKPTILQSVPVVLDWWGRGGVQHEATWRKCVSAGEALPAATAQLWTGADVPCHNHYGNSELGQLTLNPDGATGGVGPPLPGVGLRAGTTEPGPVLARFPGLSPVRMVDGEPTQLADRSGWVDTGDLGVLGDAALRLTGRADLTINVGGNKVSPVEVEEALRSLPGVRDCAVIGKGETGARQVWAYVEAAADEFDAAVLRRRAGELLTPHKVPSVIRRVDELPRTGSGKVRRGLLVDDLS